MKNQRKTGLSWFCQIWQRLFFVALMVVSTMDLMAQGKVSGKVVIPMATR